MLPAVVIRMQESCHPRPNTFAVIPLKDTEPLRVYVGQYGPEVVEFAWTTLLMDVLVDGVVTLQDGHGFKPHLDVCFLKTTLCKA